MRQDIWVGQNTEQMWFDAWGFHWCLQFIFHSVTMNGVTNGARKTNTTTHLNRTKSFWLHFDQTCPLHWTHSNPTQGCHSTGKPLPVPTSSPDKSAGRRHAGQRNPCVFVWGGNTEHSHILYNTTMMPLWWCPSFIHFTNAIRAPFPGNRIRRRGASSVLALCLGFGRRWLCRDWNQMQKNSNWY